MVIDQPGVMLHVIDYELDRIILFDLVWQFRFQILKWIWFSSKKKKIEREREREREKIFIASDGNKINQQRKPNLQVGFEIGTKSINSEEPEHRLRKNK